MSQTDTTTTEPSSNGRWTSPDEMLNAAKQNMLGGREPTEWEDWARLLNFVAFNVMPGAEQSLVRLFRMIYTIPLSEAEGDAIAEFQAGKKVTTDV